MLTLETGIASGVRRIEAITGSKAVEKMLAQRNDFIELAAAINRPVEETVAALKEIAEQNRELQKEIKRLKAEKFSAGTVSVGQEINLNGLKVMVHNFGEVDNDEISGWVDRVKGLAEPAFCAATGIIEGKPTFLASASAKAEVHVGNISRDILSAVGGRGGGKENFARGSYPAGVNPEDIFRALTDKLKK